MKKEICAGGIIIGQEGKIVIVKQQSPKSPHSTWSLPKGHKEWWESLKSCAIREIGEETGLKKSDLTFIKELGSYVRPAGNGKGGVKHGVMKEIHLFLFTTTQTNLKPKDAHNPEALWVTIEEAMGRLSYAEDRAFLAEKKNHLVLPE